MIAWGEGMVFISIDDFFEKASSCKTMTRQEEIECVVAMKNGDTQAREKLVQSYIPTVAAHIKRAKPHLQTLGLVLYCMNALEKAVDSFNFLQDSETFAHHLNWALRQAVVSYMVR